LYCSFFFAAKHRDIMSVTRPTLPGVSIDTLPGTLPHVGISGDIDHEAIALGIVDRLAQLQSEDLLDDALWRDKLALTGTYRTLAGASIIASAWKKLYETYQQGNFRLVPDSSNIGRLGPHIAWINARVTFTVAGPLPATCSGTLRLVPAQGSQWKIWCLSTFLEKLNDYPDVDDLRPAHTPGTNGVPNGSIANTISGGITASLYDCVIVGAGAAGLTLAGRLKALSISALTLERDHQIGNSWAKRYSSLRAHTPRNYNQLPFARVWGPEYPDLLSIGDVTEGLQKFAKLFDLNVWVSTALQKAAWSEECQQWEISVCRDGQEQKVRARHLVFATGNGTDFPIMPSLANREKFPGTVLHSVEYKDSHSWGGKKGVVIGAANTGHDVAVDMVEAGLSSVTMVQRGSTPILPVQVLTAQLKSTYTETTPVELADRLMWGPPTSITRLTIMTAIKLHAKEINPRLDLLEQANFKVDRDPDVMKNLNERRGGHYVDIGGSDMVIAGQIKMKSDSPLAGFTDRGLVFEDGSTLDADVVVFATGFEKNMRLSAEKFLEKEVSEKLEDFAGLDAEGETRGSCRPLRRKLIEDPLT
jgi:cation diffusion facilitator CzcD-associated flavoprotein CzcO